MEPVVTITSSSGDRSRDVTKFCRLVLVLVGMLISPFPTCFYPVGAQTSSEVASLINQLRNGSAEARRDAANALGRIGAAAKDAIPQLVVSLNDPDKNVRLAAAYALSQIRVKEAVPHLVDLLKDPDKDVHLAAVVALGQIGAAAWLVVPPPVDLLNDFKVAVPQLVVSLNDPDRGVRRAAADALGHIGPGAKAAVPPLVDLLKDPDKDLRRAAVVALGRIGAAAKAAVPQLVVSLNAPDMDVRLAAADALGHIGPGAKAAVPPLVDLLKDPDKDLRRAAFDALGHIGPGAKAAVPPLVDLLKDPDKDLRRAAVVALGRIGAAAKAAVPQLVVSLKDPDKDVCRAAAEVLGKIGSDAKDAVPQLVVLLNDPDQFVRWTAVDALGQIGAEAKAAIPHLVQLLKDPDKDVCRAAAEALATVSEGLSDKNKPDVVARQALEEALKALEEGLEIHNRPWTDREYRVRIKRAIDDLKALERAAIISQVSTWFQKALNESWVIWVIIAYLSWLLILWAIFIVKPLWLMHWNEALKNQLSVKIAPAKSEFSIGIPLGYLSVITLMAYHRHVLDAWVRSHIKKARENFNELKTVKDREVHVSSPVKVNGQFVAEFSVAAVRAHVGRADRQCRWLIVGEGGAGKTSLACQIARWGMAPDKANRAAPHLMLPVLIEDELGDPGTPAGLQRLTEAIRGKLQALIGSTEPIFPELLKHLLRRLRVIVIIDHLTEMSQTTRDQIRFDAADFPAAALIVTARTDVLEKLPKHIIEPMRIKGTRLSAFIDAYLNQRRKRDLFEDEEYFEACKQLSRMVSERNITLLLAKLYADQMVAAKESKADQELPKTIPDLMLCYLNELNRNVGAEDNRTVQRDCKIIAWECLKASYRPAPAERTAVIEALKVNGLDERTIEDRLTYLLNRLRVIQVSGVAEDRIRSVLDPLAEYLAGLQVVEENKDDKRKWERFLENADRMPGAPEAIRGFLLAVRDCCLASKSEVPDFVPDELGRRGGLEPEVMQRLQLKQRVQHYIENLDLPHEDDRKHAAETLGQIGAAAKDAVPQLIELLKDPGEGVRRAAAGALGQIGAAAAVVVPRLAELLRNPVADVREVAAGALGVFGAEAKDAVPLLVALLKDPGEYVRRAAAYALGRIGPEAKDAIPHLIELLKDPDEGVRRAAAYALGKIGPEAKDAIPHLIELLKDPGGGVPSAAHCALGEIGAAAKDAIPHLVELLKDPNVVVREVAAGALGVFGAETKDAIPHLIELLRNPVAGVRGVAAGALGKIGPEAKDAIPHLIELLKDPYENVRRAAAYALGKIGSAAKDAIPHLVELLKDPGEDVRRAAAGALGVFGAETKDAIPHLIELLRNPVAECAGRRWRLGQDRSRGEGRHPSPHRVAEGPL